MRNKVFKVILELLPLFFIIGLVAALVYSIFYSAKLEEQISERDKTIQELSFRSKLVEEYFDYGTKPDDSTIIYYTLKESKIPKQIVKEKEYEYIDRVQEKVITREPAIYKGDSNISVSQLTERYNALQRKYNQIIDTNYTNELEIKKLKLVIGLIEKNYGITYTSSVDSNIIRTSLENTDKIDSALMLLPYYRDRLEQKEDGTWMIKLRNKWLFF